MNPKPAGDFADNSRIRVSLCVKDAQRAAALREKLKASGEYQILDAIWDQPSLLWATDAVLLKDEDILHFNRAIKNASEYYPAMLVEAESQRPVEEIAALLGKAPFATFPASVPAQQLRDLVSQAASHSRMQYAAWYQADKATGGIADSAALSLEPTLTLESLLLWLKSKHATDEVCRVLGEMFEKWSGASGVMLLSFASQHLQDQLTVEYCSPRAKADSTKWTWPSSDPLVVELERQEGVVTGGPEVFRWAKVLNVRCMVPLRAQGVFMGVLAFSDREGAPFTPKDLHAIGVVAAKMSQVLFLWKQAKALADSQKPAAQEEKPKEVLRKQQLEIIGRMAMRSSHELKNCLVSIRTFTQLFPEKYADEQFRKDFYQVVSKEVERLNGLVEKLLFFAQPVQLKFTQEKITDLISEAFTLFSAEDLRNVQLHKVFGHKHPTVWLDRQHMLVVFFHIIQNSLHALSNGGKLVVVTEDHAHADFPEGVLVVRFMDTGRGIMVKDPDEPFEPFFSTKARGMGLGLTISKRIVEEHGGTIRLESTKERGTEVILCLPRKIPRWDTQATAQNAAGVSQ